MVVAQLKTLLKLKNKGLSPLFYYFFNFSLIKFKYF